MNETNSDYSFELATTSDFIEEFEGGMGNLENGLEMKFLFSTEDYG
jgi:hypothetical protein